MTGIERTSYRTFNYKDKIATIERVETSNKAYITIDRNYTYTDLDGLTRYVNPTQFYLTKDEAIKLRDMLNSILEDWK